MTGIDNSNAKEADWKFLVRGEVRVVAEKSGTDMRMEAISSYEKATCCGRGVGEMGFDREVGVVSGDGSECLGPLLTVRSAKC